MKLSNATAAALPAAIARPVPRKALGRRIVHLGMGAFHRAHQAIYTQDAIDEQDPWHVVGVSLRSPDVRDTLAPQDGLYTVTERANGVTSTRLVTVIDRVLVASEDACAVIDLLAAADTPVVTLTITEKGYYRHPATGALRLDDPAIAGDLCGGTPRTIYGYLAAAISRRRASGAGGLTLVSCDNLAGNGALLMRLLTEFLGACDPDLAIWALEHVLAPNTMVDRIVPASSPSDRALVSAAIGMEDAAAIVTEPFRQWVIADRFAGPRPRWERAGAQIVDEVEPFELAKLRLLNASHSTLAYMGLQLGYAFVHQAIADPVLRDFVTRQMRVEAIPSLTAAEGLDPDAYVDAILTRFANADLHHRLDQIAMDGSQKISQRWLAAIEDRLAEGRNSPHLLTSVAAWIAYTANAPRIADDPLLPRYAAIWEQAGDDIDPVVGSYVAGLGIFSSAFRAPPVMSALSTALVAWKTGGPHATLREALKGRIA